MTFHVKGGIFLTGNQWSSTRTYDDRGHRSGYAWRFDFNEGREFDGDELWFNTNLHALCVRRPGNDLDRMIIPVVWRGVGGKMSNHKQKAHPNSLSTYSC